MKPLLTIVLISFHLAGFSQVSLVKDIYPGEKSSYANAAYQCGNGVLFFNAEDETHGYQLWRSNGTDQGTYLLKEVYSSPNNILISGFSELNGNVFFVGGSTKKLWKSDGTTIGTTVVKNFDSSNFYDLPKFYRLGNHIYFNGAEDTNGQELWRTDGTVGGILLIKDIFSFGNHSRPDNFGSYNGKLLFSATRQAEGFELWTSDGTSQGTTLVKDIQPGINGSGIHNLISTPIGVFFQANDGTNGIELWVSDGTADGTHLVKDLDPTGNGFNSNQGTLIHAYANGKVVFNGKTPATGNELFVTDGTEAGTQLLKEFSPGSSSGMAFNQFFTFQDRVVFVGPDGSGGFEPWISDGTVAGTKLLADINPGPGSSNPTDYTIHQNKLYFTAFSGVTGRELWVSDGTEAGTLIVTDIVIGPGNSDIDNISSCGNLLFFYANDGIHGAELFRLGVPNSSLISLMDKKKQITIFPNPSKNWFEFNSNDLDLEGSLMEIIDLNGQLIKSTVLTRNSEPQNISDLGNGIYILQLRIENQVLYGKLVVSN